MAGREIHDWKVSPHPEAKNFKHPRYRYKIWYCKKCESKYSLLSPGEPIDTGCSPTWIWKLNQFSKIGKKYGK